MDGSAAPSVGRWRNRVRDPATGRAVWWVELVVLVALYYVYTGSRGFADGSESSAMHAGATLLRWERLTRLDIELGLNHWLQGVPVLAVICCYYYATLHFIVTPSVLFWMHRRHPGSYARARWALVFTTVICLIGFFTIPMAPPRLLPGTSYVDTMAYFSDWGWWSGNASAAPDGLDEIANQYAAMPSMHCAWALWSGILIARFARRRWQRVLGALYPAATVFVVMATANHYVLDAVAGWAVLGVAALAAVGLGRLQNRRRGGSGAEEPAAPIASAGAGAAVSPGARLAGQGRSAPSSPVAAPSTTAPPTTAPSTAPPESRPGPDGH